MIDREAKTLATGDGRSIHTGESLIICGAETRLIGSVIIPLASRDLNVQHQWELLL